LTNRRTRSQEQNRADEAFAQLSAERDAKEWELKKQLQKLQETLYEKVPRPFAPSRIEFHSFFPVLPQ
jgi:hypothetical protein